MSAPLRLLPAQPHGYPDALVNVETEAALLGAMLIDNSLIDPIAERISINDFCEPAHQRIYSGILSEVGAGRVASSLTMRNHFVDDPALADLGGANYLIAITNSSGIIVGARDFAHAIADLAKRRRLFDAMRELTADLSTFTDNPVESLVDRLDSALSAALQRTETTRSAAIATAFDRTLSAIDDEAAGLTPRGIKVAGFDDWNALTGNMRRGEVIILAGRPSMGKSAVAVTAALCAARAGHGTLLISLEMSVDELMTRAISDLVFNSSRTPTFDQVRRGDLTAFDRERIAEVRQQIDNWPMVLTDPPELRIGRLAMMIRRYSRQMVARGQSLDVVFLDYLGLVRSDDRKAKRYEEVSEISRAVKRIAKECNVAIVLLAQLNREVEKREDKRPQLSDLRDSGDIEQDADTVLFVYREEYYLERSEPDLGDKKRAEWELAITAARDRIEINAAKRRNGKIGKRTCYFFGANQAVRSSRYYHEQYA